jgi:phage portal protein BeeE
VGFGQWLARVLNPKRATPERSITDLESYINALQSVYYSGIGIPGYQQTLAGEPAEKAPDNFVSYAQQLYAANGPIFALTAVRMLAFSGIRFQFQRMVNGRPSRLFGSQALGILEHPWQGATTQDFLTRMILDADLAGNAYFALMNNELVRLRPDWTYIVLQPRAVSGSSALGYKRMGYVYQEQGIGSQFDPVFLPVNEVIHFAPLPDPLATYRGMSWVTPVIREFTNDKLMTRHQTKFFENGATPNLFIKLDSAVKFEDFLRFKENFRENYEGVEKAYSTMVLGGGADATVVGADFHQMSFTSSQGRIETRLAAAARVPVTIVGFSEGLQGSSLNSGNFREARRELADMTMHPLWQNVCGSIEHILNVPGHAPGETHNVRLWYDSRDVPFLREDARDAAEITATKASAINSLITAGYEAGSVVEAVTTEDLTLLRHTGLFSVQLQPPRTEQQSQNQPIQGELVP